MGVRKLKHRLKALLRENKRLNLELEFKSVLNGPLEGDSQSSEARIRELEKTVKGLKEVNSTISVHFYFVLLILVRKTANRKKE